MNRTCVVCGTMDDLKPGGFKCNPHEAQYPTYPIPGTCICCGCANVDLGVSPLCAECLEDEAYEDYQDMVRNLGPMLS